MQTANIMVAVGGDQGNIVPKYDVTAAEIAVLRAIHGEDSVFDVEPNGSTKTNSRQELSRLRETYGGAMDGNGNRVLNVLYPGAAARVFENIDELGIPQEFFKAKTRASAKPAEESEDEVDLDGMTKAELIAHAKKTGLAVDEKAKKDDLLAEIKQLEADAGEEEAGDGIQDMGDGKVFE